MTNKVLSIEMGHALGIFGLFLMLVIARLANHAYEPQQTAADRLTSFLARRVIDGDRRDWLGGRSRAGAIGAALRRAHAPACAVTGGL